MNFDLIEEYLGLKIENYTKLTDNAYILETDKIYLLKKSTKNLEPCYDYLKSQNVSNVLYPLKKFLLDGHRFLLFDYLSENKYPKEKKIYDLKNALFNLHEATKISKEAKKNNFKYLYRLYKKLDYKFRVIDSLISETELREVNTDFDWIILSKYSLFIDVKKEMYRLQMQIHQEIDKKISLFYAINHGRPSLSHLIDRSLISFDESRFGFIVSDISKFYCINEDIKIDWFSLIDEWLSYYQSPFYKTYFKFMTLYIFLINLNIDFKNEQITISNYVQVHNKLKKILIIFKDY